MNTNQPPHGILTWNSRPVGTVTRKMVLEIARELAVINGHSAQDVSKHDWEQAKRELMGQSDLDPTTAVLESAPESERWDLLPGSTLRKVPAAASEDEDDDGCSVNEQLVLAGIGQAEHDQMLQARRNGRAEDLAGPELF